MGCKRKKIRQYRVVVNTTLTKTDKRPGLCERHFWVFAFGIIIVSIVTRVFDFSLMPPSYQGLFITRPYYPPQADIAGKMHIWPGLPEAMSNTAWAIPVGTVPRRWGATAGPSSALRQPSIAGNIDYGLRHVVIRHRGMGDPAVRLDHFRTGLAADTAFAAEVIWVWLCALVGFAAG